MKARPMLRMALFISNSSVKMVKHSLQIHNITNIQPLILLGLLTFSVLITMLSLSVFNVTGVTVTQRINSLTRSVLDVTRTIVIWAFGLCIGWE